MKKFLTALGTAALMALTVAPASAGPPVEHIPSVDVDDDGVQGAEHACDALLNRAVKNPNRDAQLYRHGCIDEPVDPDPYEGYATT